MNVGETEAGKESDQRSGMLLARRSIDQSRECVNKYRKERRGAIQEQRMKTIRNDSLSIEILHASCQLSPSKLPPLGTRCVHPVFLVAFVPRTASWTVSVWSATAPPCDVYSQHKIQR